MVSGIAVTALWTTAPLCRWYPLLKHLLGRLDALQLLSQLLGCGISRSGYLCNACLPLVGLGTRSIQLALEACDLLSHLRMIASI